MLLCLKTNKACFDLWRKKYATSLKETQLILEHIAENDDEDTRAVRKLPEFHKFLDHVEKEEFVDEKGKSTLSENVQEEADQTVEITNVRKHFVRLIVVN